MEIFKAKGDEKRLKSTHVFDKKRLLLVFLVTCIISSLTTISVLVHAQHTNEHFWVEPAVKYGEAPDLTYFNVSVWVENAWDMVGWAMSVHVDPDVLEVLGSSEGTFLKDFVDAWNADNPGAEVSTDFYVGAVDKEGGNIIDTDCMIIGYWKIPVNGSANGTGMLCEYYFKSKNLTAYSLIDLFDVRVYDQTVELYIENVTDGHYNQPTMKYQFPVTVDEWEFNVVVESNSIVSDFEFKQGDKEIRFNATGLEGTAGFCNVTIPMDLMKAIDKPWLILVDDIEKTYTQSDNGTHTFLYFTYTHTTHKILIRGTWVVPEFQTLTPLLLALAILAVSTIALKRRRL